MGIGFAIPISIVKKVIPQIIQHGSVTRGWIGIQAQDLTEDLKKSFNLDVTSGCLITAVVLASPAEQAGLKAGDVIVEIDTKKFFDTSSMIGVISELQPGSKAKVKLIREEKLMTMEVQVGKRPNLVN
jgi:serine protease DegQ